MQINRVFMSFLFSILVINGQFAFAQKNVSDISYADILTTHPRIIITASNRKQQQNKTMGFLKPLFDRFINASHSPERGTSAINRHIFAEGYAYLMTEDIKFSDNAISAMENVPNYMREYGTSPDSIADSLEGLAIGFDWCYDRIVKTGKKEKFIYLIKQYANQAKAKFENDIYTDFHNYALNYINAVLFAGLSLWGEDPEAQEYLDWARGIMESGRPMNKTIYKTIDSINATDGTCNWEAPSYQRHSLFRILKYVDALDTATNRKYDLWHTKFAALENAGYYIMYLLRPDGAFENIGDVSDPSFSYKEINNLAALQGKFRNGYFTNFLDQYFSLTESEFNSSLPLDQGYQYQIFYLIWYDPDVRARPLKEIPKAKRFGDEIVMRTGWGKTDTFITFKAGFHWGGHAHLDHGSFTIFKNAPLAIDSGYYDSWHPGTHIWDYWKRTVAHNTLIILNQKEAWPAYAGSRLNDGGQRMGFRKYNLPYTDSMGYFSSGSTNEPLSFAYLQEHIDEFRMGEIKIFQSNNTYDYILADLTNAYNNTYSGKGNNQKAKVSMAQREFVYLKPDYVVILDRMNLIDKSSCLSWLLHSGKYSDPDTSAPYIKMDGQWIKTKTGIHDYAESDLIRIDNDSGRLFCQTLLPKTRILNVIGGKEYEFWVNNRNIPITESTIRGGEEPGAWRIELQPKNQEKETIFLNVLYPCDIKIESMPETQTIETLDAIGAQVGDCIALFSKNGMPSQKISYSASGGPTLKHAAFNLFPNTKYAISVQNKITGNTIKNTLKTSSSGILSFSTEYQPKQKIEVIIEK